MYGGWELCVWRSGVEAWSLGTNMQTEQLCGEASLKCSARPQQVGARGCFPQLPLTNAGQGSCCRGARSGDRRWIWVPLTRSAATQQLLEDQHRAPSSCSLHWRVLLAWLKNPCLTCLLLSLPQEYKQKLARVTQVRKELKSHIQSLPDLSLLPNVTGGLAPLPSAGDLFSTD